MKQMSDEEYKVAKEEAMALGQSAQRVLDEPAWQKIHGETMDMLFKGFLTVPSDDIEKLKDINQAGRALQKIQTNLENLAIISKNLTEEE